MGADIKKSIALDALKSQRILFVMTFLIGTIGVLVLRELGFGSVISSGYAVSVMILYFVVCTRKNLLFRPSTLGDNLYYLGFLYTLVSLSYTLYKYSEFVDITFIIQNFGIAMATTLAGLLGRVTLNQERDDPELYEHAIRMSLTDAAAHTIGMTSKIRSDLTTLRTSIIQSVNEGVLSSVEKMNQAAEKSSQNLDNHLAHLFSELQLALGKVAKKLDEDFDYQRKNIERQTSDAWSKLHTDLSQSSEIHSKLARESIKFITSLEKLNNSFDNVTPLDEDLFQGIVNPVEQLRDELLTLSTAIVQSVTNVSAVRESAESLKSQLGGLTQSFGNQFSVNLGNINSEILMLSNSVGKLSLVINSLTEKINTQSEELTKLINTNNAGYLSLINGLQESSKETQATIKTLQESIVNATADAVTQLVKLNARSEST